MKEIDPNYSYPGYYFNSGQMLATTGLLKEDDFAPFMDFGEPSRVHDEKTFPCVDQSLLNYIIPREEEKQRLSVCKMDYMYWGWGDLDGVNYHRWRDGVGYPYLIHWAGSKPEDISQWNGSHLWKFFEHYDQTREVPSERLMNKWFDERTVEMR